MRMRVMIVEDEALVSEFIEAALEDTPHTVVGVAEDGCAALRLAEVQKPDLALVDITLPGRMNGLELAKHLRARQPGMRLVFATGSHDPATRAKAAVLSPDGFLKKPFLPDHLLATLDACVKGRKS